MNNHFRRFSSEEEVDLWIEKYKELFPKSTDSDKNFLDALYYYTASANAQINNHLRGLSYLDETCFIYPYMKQMIEKIPLYNIPENIVVYRYIRKRAMKYLCDIPIRKGTLLCEKGFCSTSLLPHSADDHKEENTSYTYLVISVPAGAKGTYVGLTDTLTEYEVLLAPNSLLRVDSIYFPFRRTFKCTLIID